MSDTKPVDPSVAAARRAKKREQDRHCQRKARERTKNRIAHLEALVEDLKKQSATEQLQELWKQRDGLVTERDSLADILDGIERLVRKRRGRSSGILLKGEPADQDARSPSQDEDVEDVITKQATSPSPSDDEEPELLAVNHDSGFIQHQPSLDTTLPSYPTPIQDSNHHNRHTQQCIDAGLGAVTRPFDLAVGFPASPWSGSPPHVADQHVPGGLARSPEPPCACPHGVSPAQRPGSMSLWTRANEILAAPVRWSAQDLENEDEFEEDAPVRAMVEGWDAVEARAGGVLPPSWQKLRQIDETLFQSCGKIERLAIMKTMHGLLRSHVDPARRSNLPNWYLARPSQNIAHSYAIDFFAWPGVRERFIFHEHQYCSNGFWSNFAANLRVLWPFELRDCYSRNIVTCKYHISPEFLERIRDIRTWTMRTDMFQAFPDLSADIPAFASLTASLTIPVPMQHRRQHLIEDVSMVPDSSSSDDSNPEDLLGVAGGLPVTSEEMDAVTFSSFAAATGFMSPADFPTYGNLDVHDVLF